MNQPRFSRKSHGGFTLVEVVISMGIMIVTLVPMLGLMANGLTQVGSNIDKNQAVNICQQVFVAAQQQDFFQFANMAVNATSAQPTLTYYTAEGDAVPLGNSAIVYTSSVTYLFNNIPSATYLASAQPTATTPPLITMSIKISKTPGGTAGSGKLIASFVGTVSCPDVSTYSQEFNTNGGI